MASSSSSSSSSSAAADLLQRWVLGGVAACCGEAATFPLDFTKVRLQLQGELGKTLTGEAATGKARGMLATAAHIARTEGLLAMYGGLSAAALRQFVYGGIGVGLYVPVRTLVIGADADPKQATLLQRILSGALSGSIGQIVANPFDLVKVRLQADGRLKSLGQPPRYKGTWDALTRIPREEGVRGFYKGLGPSVGRAAVINGCGIASYDQTKVVVLQLTGRDKGLVPQVLGSLVSGLVSAIVSTPFDVVSYRGCCAAGARERKLARARVLRAPLCSNARVPLSHRARRAVRPRTDQDAHDEPAEGQAAVLGPD